jgi:preprotein translocase subunit SecG
MLLYYAFATLHVIVCVILVLVVLLQSGRGADLAGAFGGGATQTAFGSRGPASFLSKMTTIAAIVFMLTSIGLSLISTKTEAKSVLERTRQSAPARKAPAPTSAPVATPTPKQINRRVEELEKQKAAGKAGAGSAQQQPEKPTAPAQQPPNK